MIDPQLLSAMPTWLQMLAQIYPPQHVVLIGAGNGMGPLVAWLQSLSNKDDHKSLKVTLLEPDQPAFKQLAKRTGEQARWIVLSDMVVPNKLINADNAYPFHEYSLTSENGYLDLDAVKPLWPGIALKALQQVTGVSLNQLLPADWLLLDCLPVAELIEDIEIPQSTRVILTRAIINSEMAPRNASFHDINNALEPKGFKAIVNFEERNSKYGKVIFVREPLKLQSRLEAETQAKQAEIEKVLQAQKHISDLNQALADMQCRLDEEMQAKQVELHKVSELQKQISDLILAKNQLQRNMEVELRTKEKLIEQINQLQDEKEKSLKQIDELRHQLEEAKETLKDLEMHKLEAKNHINSLTQEKLDLKNYLEAEQHVNKIEIKKTEEFQNQIDELNTALKKLESEKLILTTESKVAATLLKQYQTVFKAEIYINEEISSTLFFVTKSESVFKNKQGLIKFELPINTPAYLLNNDSGDFDIAPEINQINIESNKAYDFSGKVNYQAATQPVVWLFEYNSEKKKISSHNFQLQDGEFRGLFKTNPASVTFSIGIRLGGIGSLDPHGACFRFQNSLAIEVAETLKNDTNSIDKKITDVQAKLQKEQQKQNQNSLRQIESFLRLQNYCGTQITLPDMHGWPISPDLGMYMIRLIESGDYDGVVEFGSGTSTLLIALAIQKNAFSTGKGKPYFISFEHLEEYQELTADYLKKSQLSEIVQLVCSPLVELNDAEGRGANYYDCASHLRQFKKLILQKNPKLLVFVDGPPAATGPLARYPAMPALEAAFDGAAEIHYLMDDFIRQDERDIVDLWQATLEKQGRLVARQELNHLEKQACLLIVKPAK